MVNCFLCLCQSEYNSPHLLNKIFFCSRFNSRSSKPSSIFFRISRSTLRWKRFSYFWDRYIKTFFLWKFSVSRFSELSIREDNSSKELLNFSWTMGATVSLELISLLLQLKSPKIKSEKATHKNCLLWKMVRTEESSTAGCEVIEMK